MNEPMRLVHFVSMDGNDEYIALLSEGEDPMYYREEFYEISCVCELVHVSGDYHQLPLSRTFKEH